MLRPLTYAAIAVLLVILAVLGVREVVTFRSEVSTRERADAQSALAARIDTFEDDLEERVGLWFANLREGEVTTDKERYLRQRAPWFDAVYVWEAGEVVWPPMSPAENIAAFRTDPCAVRAVQQGDAGDPLATGAAWMKCLERGRGRAFAYFAVSEAAEAFLNGGKPEVAESIIRQLSPGGPIPLADGPAWGVSTWRLVALRHQYARALIAVDRPDLAERMLERTEAEILDLPGSQLDEVLDPLYIGAIRPELARLRRVPAEEEEPVARARRRLAAWRVILDGQLDPQQAPVYWAGSREVIQSDGDPPWLLFYARLDVNNVLAAFQLDQPELVRAFVEQSPERIRDHITVRTLDGRVLHGASGPMQVYQSFDRVLPHLVAGLVEGAVPTERYNRALLAQVAMIVAGLGVGAAALRSLVRSDREQEALLRSQREFITRVTHELKTPLAGIRLMAENLEMGAYRDETQRETFARQIVKEADRLTARVEEVLRAAAGPRREDFTDTDVAALLREVVDRWRPLFEQNGATIELDAPERCVVPVMPGPLRDALTNLFDNALKYRRTDRPLRVRARLTQDRRWTTFEVIDNGLGVPRAMRRAIFERFRRVEGPGRGRSGGHGLGLSFVADAAAGHDGRVECRDGTDGGASFVLRVPNRRR